jgi:hypothetical protein
MISAGRCSPESYCTAENHAVGVRQLNCLRTDRLELDIDLEVNTLQRTSLVMPGLIVCIRSKACATQAR